MKLKMKIKMKRYTFSTNSLGIWLVDTKREYYYHYSLTRGFDKGYQL